MHPLIAQQLAADRTDRLMHEAEAWRLGSPSRTERPRPISIRERISLAIGGVHLVHRGSAA